MNVMGPIRTGAEREKGLTFCATLTEMEAVPMPTETGRVIQGAGVSAVQAQPGAMFSVG